MKYYTAFIFADSEIHCTHKYLGTLGAEELSDVEAVISRYFSRPSNRVFPVITFDKRAMFGPDGTIPVLLPSDMDEAVLLLKPVLRARLNRFKTDTFGGYKPHVTTTADKVEQFIVAYALCSGKKVLRTWPT